ncbi:hypothetical protein PoB_002749800 [Plakobranchus ocellatus]|uniref:Uncharacterized protein n=1 Tax=Plakobranchus ocellatus TaxID=259542 RepID=A0AAV4A2R7_9GAST|nr:hypothetical protein PoB_002749800 [Plakobranchus ocellatus]
MLGFHRSTDVIGRCGHVLQRILSSCLTFSREDEQELIDLYFRDVVEAADSKPALRSTGTSCRGFEPRHWRSVLTESIRV